MKKEVVNKNRRSYSTPEGFIVLSGMIFASGKRQDYGGRWHSCYVRRDVEKNVEIIIVDYGGGSFTFSREAEIIFPLASLKEAGYENISEDVFNNIYIEAVNWITKNKPKKR